MSDQFDECLHELYELGSRLMLRIGRAVGGILEEGMTLSQFLVLWYIGSNTAGTVSALAEIMGVTRSAITSLCDRLETAGYLTRARAANDRRSVRLELTETGRRKLAELEAERLEILRRHLGQLPAEDLARLREILRKLSAGLDDR